MHAAIERYALSSPESSGLGWILREWSPIQIMEKLQLVSKERELLRLPYNSPKKPQEGGL